MGEPYGIEIFKKPCRLFRMLRPLCLDLPLKLSLHDSIPELNVQ